MRTEGNLIPAFRTTMDKARNHIAGVTSSPESQLLQSWIVLVADGPLRLRLIRAGNVPRESSDQSHIRLPPVQLSKAGVRSGSRSTIRISSPRSWVDCGKYWSARPEEPEAIGADGPWQVAGNSNQRHRATFPTKLPAFNRRTEESGFRNTLELSWAVPHYVF
jgi:hypothetical protein